VRYEQVLAAQRAGAGSAAGRVGAALASRRGAPYVMPLGEARRGGPGAGTPGRRTGVTLRWPQKGAQSRRQHSSSTLAPRSSATAASSSATAAASASRLSSSARTGQPSASPRLKPAARGQLTAHPLSSTVGGCTGSNPGSPHSTHA